jgi:uncharacterized membrane protein
MADFDTMYAFAASYRDMSAAKADFDAVTQAHHAKTIGKFQAAIFTKEADGKVKIVNTTSTTRTTGAKWGTAVGALVGVLFPPTLVVDLVAGGTLGALSGNLVKGWGADEIKRMGEALDQCDVGVVAIVESIASEGAPALLERADRCEVQQFDTLRDQLTKVMDEE